MTNKIQVIVITLIDGRTGTFTGPVQFTDDESAYIRNVKSFEKELPEDCVFETLLDDKDE